MTTAPSPHTGTGLAQADVPDDLVTLKSIAQRVLWLSTPMIHHAKRVRRNPAGLKVGGHQASCASIVQIMTSLWFEQLQPGGRESVKPHASPVLHGINYRLDESTVTTLRALGGLQSFEPTEGPRDRRLLHRLGGHRGDRPDLGAMARRYAQTTTGGAGTRRQYSLVGGAKLDEDAEWRAILDPGIAELWDVVWIIDLNRQSLDRMGGWGLTRVRTWVAVRNSVLAGSYRRGRTTVRHPGGSRRDDRRLPDRALVLGQCAPYGPSPRPVRQQSRHLGHGALLGYSSSAASHQRDRTRRHRHQHGHPLQPPGQSPTSCLTRSSVRSVPTAGWDNLALGRRGAGHKDLVDRGEQRADVALIAQPVLDEGPSTLRAPTRSTRVGLAVGKGLGSEPLMVRPAHCSG
jgi:hypothetical protein